MPAAKKKTADKRTTTRKPAAKAQQCRSNESRRFWSYILFSVGILVLFITFIEGGGLWNDLYLAFRGLFGMSSFFVGPLIIYVSIMIALDKSSNAVISKVIQGIVLLFLLCGFFQILGVGEVVGGSFFKKLAGLYSDGTKLRGGGFFSAVIGWPLLALFKRTGATIIIVLLAFTFIMLLTNLTLIDFFRFLSSPFRKGYKAMRQDGEERSAAAAEKAHQRELLREEQEKEEAKAAKTERSKPKGSRIPPETISREERKNKRIDVAKYIQNDDDAGEEHDDDNIADTHTVDRVKHDPELDIVLSGKTTLNTPGKKENNNDASAKNRETVPLEKKKEDKALAEIIKTAVAEKKHEPSINPIYVESDGQTTFFDKDSSTAVYKAPPVTLLNYAKNNSDPKEIQHEIQSKSDTLVSTLQSFGIQCRIVGISRGPSVTRYELQPAAGVKVSRITGLSDDIALNLAAKGVRMEAPIPGKAAVGVEIPNKTRDTVSIRELIESDEYKSSDGKLTFAVGRDIEGKIVVGNIATMPHLLVAGTTGSGKSVFTNSIIINILYHASPDDVKLILIDPKQVEFPIYNGIPHLLIPVVTDPRKAAGALNWAVIEMEKRYTTFAETGVRDLKEYNKLCEEKEGFAKMPQIVVIIDEFADLMMVASKEVEQSVLRIAQKARAAGMHLIIATQSPRVDVITGLIKSNIPSRVALKVSNFTDSRVILDSGGAEKLLGYGDMLYMPVGMDKPLRIQGSFVATNEVRDVVNFLKNQITAEYDESVIEEIENNLPAYTYIYSAAQLSDNDAQEEFDPMFEEAVEAVIENGQASTSYLQRRLKLGYGRAARVMDEMERMGVIGPPDGSKPRKVLITKDQWLERQAMN